MARRSIAASVNSKAVAQFIAERTLRAQAHLEHRTVRLRTTLDEPLDRTGLEADDARPA